MPCLAAQFPHRPMFFCQIVATAVSATMRLGAQAWIYTYLLSSNFYLKLNIRVCPLATTVQTLQLSCSHLGHLSGFYCSPLIRCASTMVMTQGQEGFPSGKSQMGVVRPHCIWHLRRHRRQNFEDQLYLEFRDCPLVAELLFERSAHADI
jgi:hypothetical protein